MNKKDKRNCKAQFCQKNYAHWQKENDPRVSRFLMHEEGAHAKQEVVAGGRL